MDFVLAFKLFELVGDLPILLVVLLEKCVEFIELLFIGLVLVDLDHQLQDQLSFLLKFSS